MISSCLSKIFPKVLHSRIEKKKKQKKPQNKLVSDNNILNENQIGFREKYRTSDHILTLKSITEKMFKKGSHFYTRFVDFEKAFDTVWRDALFKKLECMGVRGNTLKSLLESMYSDINYSIKLPYDLTDSVQSSTGLKQGCVFKPLDVQFVC